MALSELRRGLRDLTDARITDRPCAAAEVAFAHTARNYVWPPPPQHAESRLAAELRAGLRRAAVADELVGNARTERIDIEWDAAPGAIDLHLWREQRRGLLAAGELKVDRVDETLWDAVKMLAALKRRQPHRLELAFSLGGRFEKARETSWLIKGEFGE